MRESQIEAYFVTAVGYHGGLTRKVQWINRRGCPDRWVVLPRGRAAFVELKAPGQVPRPEQSREFDRLRTYGVEVVVLDSIKAIDEWLASCAT